MSVPKFSPLRRREDGVKKPIQTYVHVSELKKKKHVKKWLKIEPKKKKKWNRMNEKHKRNTGNFKKSARSVKSRVPIASKI